MQERIYCSEQIKIPASYPEIMKQYSKSVLAEQPSDLIDFSIKYFGRLASEKTAAPAQPFIPNVKQISDLYKSDLKSAQPAQIPSVLKSVVPEHVLSQINTWHKFATQQLKIEADSAEQPKLYLIILFCLVSPSMYEVLSSVFYCLQNGKMGYISANDCKFVFGVLSKLDYRIEKNALDAVKEITAQKTDVFIDDIVAKLGIKK
ncbi:Regulatory_subunit of cAMP-dependent protein kinase [Hexamita inflata]|uniref:Regulatory subunit of cAMP-dependent protein kinase n=2 Tax=Hexamita inflata TaxID=28002 RepID=A0AA86UZI6_9EUKA|nr:Regulatory subunit of cAMP-dependent protein kinase [Hexamita inflata]CAI9974544.1 Regulatory subunit of cAMP-dependent protein kinase [Hexamita inflata]